MFRSHAVRSMVFCGIAAGAAALAACGGSTEPVVKKDVVPAKITASTTDTLRAQAGTTVNTLLSVKVTNAAGQSIDSAVVTFAVVTGGGTLSATSVRTDTSGTASTTWTFGPTAGVQTMTAAVGTLPPVVFTGKAAAATAAAVTKVTGDNQTAVAGANVATAPAVKVTDRFGNPVANILVTFSAANGGSVTGASVSTDANGVATVGSWRLGPTAGANTLTAAVSGITPALTFTATGTVGGVTRVTITSGAIPTLLVGQTATVTAAAFDANNNGVTTATFAFTSDNPNVASVNATTGVVAATGAGTTNINVASGGITASTPVTVIGHPGTTVLATLPQAGRVNNIVIAQDQAYASVRTTGSISNVDALAGAQGWTLALGGQVTSVGVNAANTVVTAAATNGWFYIINPATRLATDSVALSAPAVRMVMTAAGGRAFVDENNFQLELIDVASRVVVAQVPLPGTVTAMKMGPGDTVLYAGTAFGTVYEINALTGAVKRQFQPTSTIVDIDVSRDGKTLVVADGTQNVVLVRLATGGLSRTIDYGAGVNAVALAPDMAQLWVAMGSTLYASPSNGTGFDTGLVPGRVTVAGATFTRIAINANGSRVVAYDDGGLNLVVFR